MRVDEGRIVGGFACAYEATANMEPDTALQRGIAASTGIHGRDTIEVTLKLPDGSTWVRSFTDHYRDDTQPCIFSTPSPLAIGVSVHLSTLAVHVFHPDEPLEIDIGPVYATASDVAGGRMFFADDHYVCAFDGERVLWKRLPDEFCGISNLRYAGGRVYGLGEPLGEDSPPTRFSLDASTGKP